MDVLVTLISSALALGYLAYFVWHLAWPVVEGEVARSDIVDIPSVAVSKRRRRHVVYDFDYQGRTYSLDRQALFWRYGFAPRMHKGDKLLISICPLNMRWSCPKRIIFNFLSLLAFQTFFLLTIYTSLT